VATGERIMKEERERRKKKEKRREEKVLGQTVFKNDRFSSFCKSPRGSLHTQPIELYSKSHE